MPRVIGCFRNTWKAGSDFALLNLLTLWTSTINFMIFILSLGVGTGIFILGGSWSDENGSASKMRLAAKREASRM